MKLKTKLLIIFSLIFFVSMKNIFFKPPKDEVLTKLRMIEDEVYRRGYDPNWIIISGKRSQWYNDILRLSAKNSQHVKGNAVDIYVFDVDCDGKFTKKDIEIVRLATISVEKNFPEYRGFFNTYLNKGTFAKRMIHIDVRR